MQPLVIAACEHSSVCSLPWFKRLSSCVSEAIESVSIAWRLCRCILNSCMSWAGCLCLWQRPVARAPTVLIWVASSEPSSSPLHTHSSVTRHLLSRIDAVHVRQKYYLLGEARCKRWSALRHKQPCIIDADGVCPQVQTWNRTQGRSLH